MGQHHRHRLAQPGNCFQLTLRNPNRPHPKDPHRQEPAPPRPFGAAVIPSNYNHHSQAALSPGQPSSGPACKIRVSVEGFERWS
jgi:hypothetical protein